MEKLLRSKLRFFLGLPLLTLEQAERLMQKIVITVLAAPTGRLISGTPLICLGPPYSIMPWHG